VPVPILKVVSNAPAVVNRISFFTAVLPTFPRLASVANFGTDYFLLKIIFLAKREREFTTKFAIAPNVC